MSAETLLDADGYELIGSDGASLLDDGAGNDCCCEPAPCTNCATGETPETILLTLAGLTLCGGCIDNGDGTYSSWAGGADLNGTDCLNRTNRSGGSCVWAAAIAATLNLYSDAGCTALIGSIASWDVTLTRAGGAGFTARIFDPVSGREAVSRPLFASAGLGCLDSFVATTAGGGCAAAGVLTDGAATWTATPGGC